MAHSQNPSDPVSSPGSPQQWDGAPLGSTEPAAYPAPPAPLTQADPIPMPPAAKKAQMAMYAAAAVAVIGLIVSLSMGQDFSALLAVAVIGALAFLFGKGKGWTRIVFTIWAALGTLGGAMGAVGLIALQNADPSVLKEVGLSESALPITLGLTALQIAVYIVALVFLWKKPVSEWLERSKQVA